MAEAKHENRAHALLSASGASRWMNCTPSARLEETFEDSGTSDFAAEGTLAHEFGEAFLKAYIEGPATVPNTCALVGHRLYTNDMEGEVDKYVDYVVESFEVAKKTTKDAVLLIEQKVDLTDYIENGFGSDDAIIVADGTLTVIDLKYGKGIRVNADENSQLKLYGLGTLRQFEMMYDIHTVKLVIVQPRLDHVSEWEISASDLLAWGEKEVRPKAKLAYAGGGIQISGEWCKWCKVKGRCATLAANNLKIAKDAFSEKPDPHLLTDAQLLEVYHKIDQISDWINAVDSYLLSEAVKGKKWAGLKLVEGKSNRVWSDVEKVQETLSSLGYEKDEYLNSKLAGLGDIEKLVGKAKFPVILGDLIIKPQGKPTLVPLSDKRAEFSSAKKDFAE